MFETGILSTFPGSPTAGMLVNVKIAEKSALDGRSVAEGIGSVRGAAAVAILRGEEMIVPRGPTLLVAGDQLIAEATGPALERLRELAMAAGASDD